MGKRNRRRFIYANRKDIVLALSFRDGSGCKGCRLKSDITIDHIIPIALGGTDELENLQMLCKECHVKKDKWLTYTPCFTYKTGKEMGELAAKHIRRVQTRREYTPAEKRGYAVEIKAANRDAKALREKEKAQNAERIARRGWCG